MKHYRYLYDVTIRGMNLTRIKYLLTTNLKTTFTYPKTIWYSERYNSGENFLLYNPDFYPYRYDLQVSEEKLNEPLRLSNRLISNISEFKVENYREKINRSIWQVQIKDKVEYSFNSVLEQLYKTYDFNKNKKLDLPVVVSARTLYAAAYSTKRNKKEYDNNVLKLILETFIEKIEYADADSISQVLFSLSSYGYYKPDIWNRLALVLEKKKFYPEFTTVSLAYPHLYRYKETKEREFRNSTLDEFGITLFNKGYLTVFEAYYSLLEANKNNINTKSSLLNLEERFPILKTHFDEYLQKFHQ